MKNMLHFVTDRIATKTGMWITLGIWIIAAMLLAVFAPGAKDYEVSRLDSIPDDAQSIIAQQKLDTYFEGNDGTPAILVFQAKKGKLATDDLSAMFDQIKQENIPGVMELVPLDTMPPQAIKGFQSNDETTALIPMNFDPALDTDEIKASVNQVYEIAAKNTDMALYVTGPAGIAVDTKDLFSRADIVLLLSTVGIILILLVVIYRSPALALIPLLAAALVYEVTNQLLGLIGMAGVPMGSQSLSIMMILLFATMIDYSLFVFSRFREELKIHESKYMAIRQAMRGVGIPVLYSGGTVLAAMLVLFFAKSGDSYNFAPLFATTMAIVMLASVTLVPALFGIFGRKSFWPLIPKVGEKHVKTNSLWSKIGHFVSKKPIMAVSIIGIFLLVSAGNIINTQYEFDTLKSFPEDMPSRVGYEILGEKFEPGDLAPTTVLFESENVISEADQGILMESLADQKNVVNIRINGITADKKAISYSMTFDDNPYTNETMDALETIMDKSEDLLQEDKLTGNLYYTGETATSVDDRAVNNRDLILIISLETILIFAMLIFLTKSVKMPIYMMGTILVSYTAALGLGMFLADLFFGIENINSRVPLYAFVFLVALGIDYNIMLISRFMEERLHQPVREAVHTAVAHTGGVISSAGLILAATFFVLTTQPIEFLFVFGFIVAVGILLDTFLIRGVLLPGLVVLFERGQERNK